MAVLANRLDLVRILLLFAAREQSADDKEVYMATATHGVPLILNTLSCVSSKLM